MTLLLLYFSLLFTCLKSLKVFKNDFSNSHKTYDHNTANFGPDEGTYNVSGPFKLMSPLQGCSIEKYAYNKTIILSNGESMTTTSYYQIYNNSIVLIKRGNCTFSDKVYYSSLLGAIGVVIGDNKNSDEWIAMEKSDDRDIKIPSVFIPHSEFNTLYKLFENVTNSIPTIPNINNNNNNNNNKNENNFDQYNDRMYNSFYNDYDQFSIKERRLLELASDTSNNENKITQLYGMLDASGEYDGSYESYSKWLTIIGLVILLIPTLWCVLGTLMMLRKVIKACIDRHRRWKRLHSIPIVRYRRQPIDITTNENSNENSIIDHSSQIDNNNNNDELNNGNDIIIEINLDDKKTDVIVESGTIDSNNIDSNNDNIDNNNNDNSDNENTNTNGKTSKFKEKKGKQKQSDKYQSIDTIDEDIIDVNIDNNNNNTNNNNSKNINRIQNKFKHKTEMFTNRLINQANMLKNGDYYEKNQPLNSECVICLDDFKFNERIKLLPCFHGFHPHCIDPWLHTSSEFCPMCKQSIFSPETCQSKSSNSLSVNLNDIENENENENHNENSMDNVKHSQENINNMNNNDENNNNDNNNDNNDNNKSNNNNNEKTEIVSSISHIIDQRDLNEINSSNQQNVTESTNDEKINNENMVTIDLNST